MIMLYLKNYTDVCYSYVKILHGSSCSTCSVYRSAKRHTERLVIGLLRMMGGCSLQQYADELPSDVTSPTNFHNPIFPLSVPPARIPYHSTHCKQFKVSISQSQQNRSHKSEYCKKTFSNK